MIPAHENAECLTDIMARVEQLALASAEERNPLQPPSLPPEQGSLVLDIPVALVPTQPEYIRAEAFLEVSGFFTPSSKRAVYDGDMEINPLMEYPIPFFA